MSVGLMLIGVVILSFNYFRQVISKLPEHNLDVVTHENGKMELIWESSYESGNQGIDHQHKKLFSDGNNLISAIYGNRQGTDIEVLLDALIEDIEIHFTSEEALMEKWQYEETNHHKNIHRELLEEAYTLRDEIKRGVLDYVDVVNFFVYDLILNHILEEDKKYFHKVD